ncbi:hypothetical protein CALVIDRAFT_599009 [Calocera viscosa TUFC12733]|uniref:4a-hydroxytetrahydrobiopterin dehydratase n=1 Tax=Calocera viscosa (strain TUFC12733) TaxID=1330018 RepID=A0A167LD72_CALVF|nr:hypothetical protein CALVIDRAFT_599009 [Calocera viscosa TUFC12733]
MSVLALARCAASASRIRRPRRPRLPGQAAPCARHSSGAAVYQEGSHAEGEGEEELPVERTASTSTSGAQDSRTRPRAQPPDPPRPVPRIRALTPEERRTAEEDRRRWVASAFLRQRWRGKDPPLERARRLLEGLSDASDASEESPPAALSPAPPRTRTRILPNLDTFAPPSATPVPVTQWDPLSPAAAVAVDPSDLGQGRKEWWEEVRGWVRERTAPAPAPGELGEPPREPEPERARAPDPPPPPAEPRGAHLDALCAEPVLPAQAAQHLGPNALPERPGQRHLDALYGDLFDAPPPGTPFFTPSTSRAEEEAPPVDWAARAAAFDGQFGPPSAAADIDLPQGVFQAPPSTSTTTPEAQPMTAEEYRAFFTAEASSYASSQLSARASQPSPAQAMPVSAVDSAREALDDLIGLSGQARLQQQRATSSISANPELVLSRALRALLSTLPLPSPPPRPAPGPAPLLSQRELDTFLRPLYARGWHIAYVRKMASKLAPQEMARATGAGAGPEQEKGVYAHALLRKFKFATAGEAISFAAKVLEVTQEENHHPVLAVFSKSVYVRLHTHQALTFDDPPQKARGITLHDVRFAYLLHALPAQPEPVEDVPGEEQLMPTVIKYLHRCLVPVDHDFVPSEAPGQEIPQDEYGRKLLGPPSPCPNCGGRHWLKRCPFRNPSRAAAKDIMRVY